MMLLCAVHMNAFSLWGSVTSKGIHRLSLEVEWSFLSSSLKSTQSCAVCALLFKIGSRDILLTRRVDVVSSRVFCVQHVLLRLLFCFDSSPEGRPGMSDVSPLSGISGLSFDSTLLSPLLFFCLVLLPFLSYCFLPAGPFF